MQFLGITSGLFATLLLSLGGALVLLYAVKLRRRRVEVPYSALWSKILAENSAKSLWQRLKRWLSLLLHLLILLLLLLALRDPRPENASASTRNVLLIVDTSASMATTDLAGGRDRMEAAREAALSVFDSLSADDNLMVVSLDGQLRPLTPFMRPTAATRAKIAALRHSATSADLVAAMAFAARSLARRSEAELFVVSDFAFPETVLEQAGAIDLPSNARATFVQVSAAPGNVAISAFNVRRYLANRLNFEVFIEVMSTFDTEVTLELSLLANGRRIERVLLEVPPGGREVRVYPNVATGGNRLEAVVEIVSGDHVDPFPLDDRAYALLPHERRKRVLVVTEGNLFVEAPLLLNQNIEVSRARPDEYGAERSSAAGDFDVYVFDGVTPEPPERGGALYIHPDGDSSPWPVRGETTDPIIDRFERSDPLMRWMHGFRSLNILRAHRLGRGQDDTVSAWSVRGDPMFIHREEPSRRLAAIAFKIEESDFGLRPNYPLFMLNALDWLSSDAGDLIEGYRTGLATRIEARDADVEHAQVRAPSGEMTSSEIINGAFTFFPEQPGFYEFFWSATESGEGETPNLVAAANLFDPSESHIAPIAELPFPTVSQAPTIERSAVLGHRAPWVYLLVVVVILLVLEWVTFNRRVTV